MKSSSLSWLVFTLILNNSLSRNTSIWSLKNFTVSNISLMSAPGPRWAHCIQLQPCSNARPALFVFTSETWIYMSPTNTESAFCSCSCHPKGISQHIVYYQLTWKLLILTGKKKKSVYSLLITTLLLGPPPPARKASSYFVPEKWVCFLALFLHSSLLPHISTWNFKFFSQGVHFICWSQKNPVSCPNFIPDTMQWAVRHLGSASAGMTHITQLCVWHREQIP